MRAGWGLLALVAALLIVALLSRQALRRQMPVAGNPAVAASSADGLPVQSPHMTPKQQVDAVQRQVQQTLDAAAARRASEAE